MGMPRGNIANIVAVDTDTNVVIVPQTKEMKITRATFSNNNAAAARVRVFDTFTEDDTAATVHSSTVNPIVLFDINLQPGETLELLMEQGLATGIGTLLARSTVGAADPNDVAVGLFGEFI